jgi:ABC-type Fe3+/spermidine/putrescine transport system ATPase subunit
LIAGGQQQRVALARALAIRPNVLLLDEPLSNLDAKLRLEMRENITRIHQQTKITTIYVTHDQKEALSMGTDISLMYAGELIQSGSPRELYRRPSNSFVAQFIGEANLFDGEVVSEESKVTTLKSPLGEIRSSVQSRAGASVKDVSIAIRPEAIRVSYKEEAEPGFESIACELKQLTYLGEQEQLVLKTKKTGVTIKTALFDSSLENIRVGENLFCHIPQSSIMVLPKAAHLGPGT